MKHPLKYLAAVLKKHDANLLQEIKSILVPVPDQECSCGKPVVFLYPSKTFKCSRCDGVWKLEVRITRIKTGSVNQ